MGPVIARHSLQVSQLRLEQLASHLYQANPDQGHECSPPRKPHNPQRFLQYVRLKKYSQQNYHQGTAPPDLHDQSNCECYSTHGFGLCHPGDQALLQTHYSAHPRYLHHWWRAPPTAPHCVHQEWLEATQRVDLPLLVFHALSYPG